MALKDDLTNKIAACFRETYHVRPTTIVPSTDVSSLTFGNTAFTAELAFLFADIRESSQLHERYGWENAARIYQSFHEICVRVIMANEGKVRAFDGDRIMGVFAGPSKENNAVKAAMQIRLGIRTILNPALAGKHAIAVGIGIEAGQTLITKVGAGRDQNNNDLVWVGKACNYASHYAQEANNTILTSEGVYSKLSEGWKIHQGSAIWTTLALSVKGGVFVNCRSTTYECNL